MDEAVHHEPHDDHAPPAGDLGPKPVLAPNPPYEPDKFNTYFWLFFGLYLGGIVLSFTGFGVLLAIPAWVFWGMFTFMAWKQIQDGHQRTSPGLAVGLMFIPLFNIYWAFVSFLGLAKSINDYQVRWGTSTRPVNEGLALTACILLCTIVIPVLNIFTVIVSIIIWLIVMNQIREASLAIAQARLEGHGHPA